MELFAQGRELFVKEQNHVWPSLVDLYQALVLFNEGRLLEASGPFMALSGLSPADRQPANFLERVMPPAKAAEMLERLRKDVFQNLRLDLVHGRMRDKDAVMQRFMARDSDVLVATAVVEVGVDVPNATVMMIEGAERFGLAQLHQFRGRVGRGSDRSYCLLLTDDESMFVLDRLELVARTPDGFRLATEDMNRRGVGELMGARQHGMSDAAMQALREPELLNEARQEAEAVLASDRELSGHPALARAVVRRLELTSIS